MSEKLQDPLAHAGEMPDVAALINEFELALSDGPQQLPDISAAENVRYCRWTGQSEDGRQWQRNMPVGTVVKPYDGKPDIRVPLADGIVNAKVDLDVMAFWNAVIKPQTTHVNQLTAAQSAELAAVVRWMRDGPLREDLIEGVEYLSQMRNTLKYVVLMPYWKVRHGLRRETLTMQQFVDVAMQSPEGTLLRDLPAIISDPTTEATAVEALRQAYPYLKPKAARRIVRELRDDGQTEFLYREVQENRPAIRVLVPGVDIFLPEETEKIQDARAVFIRTYYTQVGLEAMEVDDNWNAEFVSAACATAGERSYGRSDEQVTEDKNSRRIEIVEALVKQNDEEGVPGIFCTVFSPNVKPATPAADVTAGHYGKHYLLDYAHGQYPLILVRTEVLGPRPDDSRGVPDILRTQQADLKRYRDALAIRAEMETNPPRKRIGQGWSKVQENFAPGSDINNSVANANIEFLQLAGNPRLAVEMAEQIQIEAEDYFGLPNSRSESHPSRWQNRQARETLQWLLAWSKALWQLAVLCYDEYTPAELAQIIGRQPLLTSRDLLKHGIALQFNARTMDMDYLKEVGSQIVQVMQFDRSGTVDTAKLVQLWLSYIDPTLAAEIVVDQKGAAQAIYQRVLADVMSIMDGNKPMLVENDPTAGMKLQFVQQILMQNPKYQAQITEGSQVFNPIVAENFQTYVSNLQHSVQETVTSKVQGRLGVADTGSAPVTHGAGVGMN